MKQHILWSICTQGSVIITKMLSFSMMLTANLVKNVWETRRKTFWSSLFEVRSSKSSSPEWNSQIMGSFWSLRCIECIFKALRMWNGVTRTPKLVFSHCETVMPVISEELKKLMKTLLDVSVGQTHMVLLLVSLRNNENYRINKINIFHYRINHINNSFHMSYIAWSSKHYTVLSFSKSNRKVQFGTVKSLRH